jgi:D-glycero-alpha-D-manno-heptose-7-phosphate kinase
LRVSFVGGGTDLPEFYMNNKEGGAVISSTINRYVYVTVSRKFDQDIRLSYSHTENVTHANEIEHPIVKACLNMMGMDNGIEITTIADIPAGTGLGSSSSFTVGLLNALYHLQHKKAPTTEWLARMACTIEIDVLGQPIGKQDQYIAAFGGVQLIKFYRFDVEASPADINLDVINDQCILHYTGRTRHANEILAAQSEVSKGNESLGYMVPLVRDFAKGAHEGDIIEMGKVINLGWELKKSLVPTISSEHIDNLVAEYLSRQGVYGAKLLGAGGEGFILVLMDPAAKRRLRPMWRDRCPGPHILDPVFGVRGSEVVFNDEQD